MHVWKSIISFSSVFSVENCLSQISVQEYLWLDISAFFFPSPVFLCDSYSRYRQKSCTGILWLTSWVQMKHSCFTCIDVNLFFLTLLSHSIPLFFPLWLLHHLLHTSFSQCLLLSSASINNIKCRMIMTPICSVLPLLLWTQISIFDQ